MGLGLLLAIPAMALGQDNTAPPPQKPPASGASQKEDQKKPSETEQNPFPEAQSEAAAKQGQQQDQRENHDAAPSAPAPQNTQKKPSTADQNPFPEAESEKAARQDKQENGAPGGQSGGDFSSSQVKGLDRPDDEGGPATEAPPAHGHNPGLARDDTRVGLFYLQTGDYKGAYERFLEATQSDPGNADAVYGLGESAWRLNKRDEALRNFRLYLSALPDGPRAKEIRKSMKKMGVEPPA
jgi:TolA-binding protein